MANVKYLRERAELLRRTRCRFDQAGFLEVQPPCLSRDCVVDAYLDPLTLESGQLGIADPRLPKRFYLQTSPESAMKRMLAAGAPSIYSIGPVFRGGEAGQLHNIEFTMLEWYEVGGDIESAIRITGDLIADCLGCDGYDTLTYREAFARSVGYDPITISTEDLFQHVSSLDATLAEGLRDDHDGLLDIVVSLRVAPELGKHRPTVLTNYPISQAALAKASATDPACAARFEVFSQGVELANGYDELLDANELRDRASENNRRRQQSGRASLSTDTTLVDAMLQGLPPCSGVALGLDRLLMLMVHETSVDAVMAFSVFDA